jgi:hypothetical protein
MSSFPGNGRFSDKQCGRRLSPEFEWSERPTSPQGKEALLKANLPESYKKRCIEENGYRYQQEVNLSITRKGQGVFVLKDNDLRSLLAYQPPTSGTLQQPSKSPRAIRRTSQHIFERTKKEEQEQKRHNPPSKHYSGEFWKHAELKWDPKQGLVNELDKRPSLGGRSRQEFEDSLKAKERARLRTAEKSNQARNEQNNEMLKSSVPMEWEQGTSWNPARNEQDRFLTNYQAMQNRTKPARKGVTLRENACRLQHSSVHLG